MIIRPNISQFELHDQAIGIFELSKMPRPTDFKGPNALSGMQLTDDLLSVWMLTCLYLVDSLFFIMIVSVIRASSRTPAVTI